MKKYKPDPLRPAKLTPRQAARLDAMTDKDIDYSDIPMLDDHFFKNATRPLLQKKQLTIRLDPDVLDWLKGMGRGYQTRINLILRSAMEHHSSSRPD